MKRIKKILASEKTQMISLSVAVIAMMMVWILNIYVNTFPKDEKLEKQYEKIEEMRKKRAEMFKDMK